MKEIYAITIQFESAPERALVLDVTELIDADDLSDMVAFINEHMHDTEIESAVKQFPILFDTECWPDWQKESHPTRCLQTPVSALPDWVLALVESEEWEAHILSESESEHKVLLQATHLAITHKGHAFVSWKL